MEYVLDTNILVQFVRNSLIAKAINEQYQLFSPDNRLYISIVSIGEIYALGYKNQWGRRKMEEIENILTELYAIPIDSRELAKMYAEIDAFSQNKHLNFALPADLSARNMGKNDIWIAATTAILGATLLTTDKDFRHLDKVFFAVECVEV